MNAESREQGGSAADGCWYWGQSSAVMHHATYVGAHLYPHPGPRGFLIRDYAEGWVMVFFSGCRCVPKGLEITFLRDLSRLHRWFYGCFFFFPSCISNVLLLGELARNKVRFWFSVVQIQPRAVQRLGGEAITPLGKANLGAALWHVHGLQMLLILSLFH